MPARPPPLEPSRRLGEQADWSAAGTVIPVSAPGAHPVRGRAVHHRRHRPRAVAGVGQRAAALAWAGARARDGQRSPVRDRGRAGWAPGPLGPPRPPPPAARRDRPRGHRRADPGGGAGLAGAGRARGPGRRPGRGTARIRDVWHDITPLARWEWVRWVQATSNHATRQRPVEVSISKMDRGKRRACCFDLSSCTDPDLARSGKLRQPS